MKFLLFLLAFLAGVLSEPQTLQLTSSASRKLRLIYDGKFDELRALHSRGSRLMVGQQPVTDMSDFFYFVNITVGTPAQTIEVQFDTLTSDIWVIDGVINTNTTKQVFHEDKSSTFSVKDNGNYYFKSAFTGWFNYYVASDNVGVANFQIPSQDILVATKFQSPESGQLGLGIPQPGKGKTVTPLTNLLKQWDAPLFTVWYDGKKNYSHGGDGGLITLGGIDTVNCDSQWNYSPLTNINQYSWQWKINGYSIGNQKSTKPYQVITATSSAWIEFPDAVLRDLLFATGGKYNSTYYMYVVQCSTVATLPDLVIKANASPTPFNLNIPASQYVVDMGIYLQVVTATSSAWIEFPDAVLRDLLFATGGKYNSTYYMYVVQCSTVATLPDLVIKANASPTPFNLNIPASQYVVDMGLDDGWCALALDSTNTFEYEDEPNTWILGDTFIRSYCSQYDYGNQRMGFAKAKH